MTRSRSLIFFVSLITGLLMTSSPILAFIQPVIVSDVTPSSFTINSRIKVLSLSDITIFDSPEATDVITDQFQITPYPLYAHSDSIHTQWECRQEKESLRKRMESLNIAQFSVADCMPETTYYFTVFSDQNIYSVTTALYNRFVYHAPQLIVNFPQSHESYNPNGYLILAQSPLAMYPVSAIVGDGRYDHAIVNLSNLFDADGLNLITDRGMDIQLIVQGDQLMPISRNIHIENGETFNIAKSYSILVNSPPAFESVDLQQLTEDHSHEFIIKINDLESVSEQLKITAHSSNPVLVPNENINIAYTGTDYVVSLEPARFQSGSASITLTISDAYDVTWTTFQIDVEPVANIPKIEGLTPMKGKEDSAIHLSFSIDLIDQDSSEVLENICLTGLPPGGKLSSPAIFEDPCWTIENTDGPFLSYIPQPDDHTDFELVVSCQSRELENNDMATATSTFQIIVEPVNDPPVISKIFDLVMNENSTSQPIAFTVTDIDHSANKLQVNVSSEMQTLFTQSSFQVQGSESNRYLTIQPTPYQSGQGEIVITVSDGELTDESRFMVNVLKYQPELLCDFNGDRQLSLDDLIIVLQVITNINPPFCYPSASLDSEQIQIDDALYIIFKLSGIVYHSGDYNPSDLKITMNEMLRLIQLFNAGGYHCDSKSEDGYAPEKMETLTTCPFHSSDFAHDGIESDWIIDNIELNRFFQLYNSDGYVPDQNSIDGFRPR
jgi:hypothetical protein